MPPIKGKSPRLNGDALKALREAGHGRRVATVDGWYDIPPLARAEGRVFDFLGKSAAKALKAVVECVEVENSEVFFMRPDLGKEAVGAKAYEAFLKASYKLEAQGHLRKDSPLLGVFREADVDDAILHPEGFYALVDNPAEQTLYFQACGRVPFACATFVIGSMLDLNPYAH